ncbi:MAG: hypothetical protein RBR16_14085 [Syntrophus sp. (in: bacteria)]|nr:hypothetical protein [Syntrophus sp. (in: bacteria)]
MEKHVVTDWWTTKRAEGEYLYGFIDGFGIEFLLKSLDEGKNVAVTTSGAVYGLCRKDITKIRPIIIDTPGVYEARNGYKVRIDNISDKEVPIGYGMYALPTCNCEGYKLIPGKRGIREVWGHWAQDGRCVFVGKSPWDIVKKIGVWR